MNRLFWNVPGLDHEGDSAGTPFEGKSIRHVAPESEANVVGSLCDDGTSHMPVIDLDVPARLVPSTTPGHSHLYIDVPMTWEQFETILVALVDANVVEAGYLKASRARKTSFVRKPGVLKPVADALCGRSA